MVNSSLNVRRGAGLPAPAFLPGVVNLSGISGENKPYFTRDLVRRLINKAARSAGMRALSAQILKGVNPSDASAQVAALASFVKANVQYHPDTFGVEQVAEASDTLARGFGDCDDLAVVTGSLLESAGKKTRLVLAGGAGPSHIFVEALVGGDWVPVDTARAPERVLVKKKYAFESREGGGVGNMGGSYYDVNKEFEAFGNLSWFEGCGNVGRVAPLSKLRFNSATAASGKGNLRGPAWLQAFNNVPRGGRPVPAASSRSNPFPALGRKIGAPNNIPVSRWTPGPVQRSAFAKSSLPSSRRGLPMVPGAPRMTFKNLRFSGGVSYEPGKGNADSESYNIGGVDALSLVNATASGAASGAPGGGAGMAAGGVQALLANLLTPGGGAAGAADKAKSLSLQKQKVANYAKAIQIESAIHTAQAALGLPLTPSTGASHAVLNTASKANAAGMASEVAASQARLADRVAIYNSLVPQAAAKGIALPALPASLSTSAAISPAVPTYGGGVVTPGAIYIPAAASKSSLTSLLPWVGVAWLAFKSGILK